MTKTKIDKAHASRRKWCSVLSEIFPAVSSVPHFDYGGLQWSFNYCLPQRRPNSEFAYQLDCWATGVAPSLLGRYEWRRGKAPNGVGLRVPAAFKLLSDRYLVDGAVRESAIPD